MSARRPLITAAASGTLLCALWFVPSANATGEDGRQPEGTASAVAEQTAAPGQASRTQAEPTAAGAGATASPTLAATGSIDTTPYLVGGATFLGLGTVLLAHSVRHARQTGTHQAL